MNDGFLMEVYNKLGKAVYCVVETQDGLQSGRTKLLLEGHSKINSAGSFGGGAHDRSHGGRGAGWGGNRNMRQRC